MDRAGGKHHATACQRRAHDAALHILDANGAPAIEDHAVGEGACLDLQTRMAQGRAQIGARHALPAATLGIGLKAAHALMLRAIIVWVGGDAAGLAGGHEGFGDAIGRGDGLDGHGPGPPAQLRVAQGGVLHRAHGGGHAAPVPTG